ncbi:MAG TPA: lactate permease LctP family transporter [Polyangiaceae bacterium]|nr:lactate permease LctP family transporter [Polyangiaceae bacterium]
MPWTQVYAPLGNLYLSAVVAALPVLVLLGALGLFRIRAHNAALLGLATALTIAMVVYGMPPRLALTSAVYGALFGLFPIGWIVLAAIFVYDVTVHTGKFDVIKISITGLAADRRIQVLLVAFSFGAFMEGAAGFSTPVAICAAMLIGIGFKPLPAAGLSLIGNTAPVAFGALGTPLITLAKVTGLPLEPLSAMVGRQLPLFSLLIPFWLVWTMAGFRGMLGVWPACLVAGISFAIPQYVVSNWFGPSLVDVVAGVISILATYVLLRVWQPAEVWRFADEPAAPQAASRAPRAGEALSAWLPWILLTIFVFVWGWQKAAINKIHTAEFTIPYLNKAVLRAPPVVAKPTAEPAVFTFNWLSATGTGLFLSGVVSGLALGVRPGELLRVFGRTVVRVRFSLLTIGAMLALGFTTRFAGSDATMGLAFASSGRLFAFFSPLLGWLGVALTGSDTSSNVLFGNLQQITAQQVGIPPLLAAAANSSGGVMGKMIDAQSIVVAGVATGQHGSEGEILRYVFWHSLVLAALVGVVVLLQCYVLPGMVPAVR